MGSLYGRAECVGVLAYHELSSLFILLVHFSCLVSFSFITLTSL